ncbi:MAG: hypothetical protein B7X91_02300 [Hydrogenophilales bacterium 17-64-11]|nr:MAG: hypothetical protein B7X91_02300 [Hydrogenophilales bacterium 17-64-11]
MQVTFDIDDRKALPLRAIPYVTSWKTPPDEIVNVLAAPKTEKVGHNLEIRNRHNELFAYQMDSQRNLVQVPASQWEAWIVTYRSLTAQLRADERSGAVNENYANWRIKAVLELPDNVFVWLDEFQAWYSRTRPLADSAPEHDGDWETESDSLCLAPIFPPALEDRLWRYSEGFIPTKPVGLEESVVIHRYPIAPEEPLVTHHDTLQAAADEVPTAEQAEINDTTTTEVEAAPASKKDWEIRVWELADEIGLKNVACQELSADRHNT